jgi:hypothetical protein
MAVTVLGYRGTEKRKNHYMKKRLVGGRDRGYGSMIVYLLSIQKDLGSTNLERDRE